MLPDEHGRQPDAEEAEPIERVAPGFGRDGIATPPPPLPEPVKRSADSNRASSSSRGAAASSVSASNSACCIDEPEAHAHRGGELWRWLDLREVDHPDDLAGPGVERIAPGHG